MIKLFENEFIAEAAAAAAVATAAAEEGEEEHTNLFLWPFIYGKTRREGGRGFSFSLSPISLFTIAKVAYI